LIKRTRFFRAAGEAERVGVGEHVVGVRLARERDELAVALGRVAGQSFRELRAGQSAPCGEVVGLKPRHLP
jgi:hypothetical protein